MSCQKEIYLIISNLVKIKVSENGHLIHLWTLPLFIMQCFCRFYLHGFAGRDIDSDAYHQSYLTNLNLDILNKSKSNNIVS